jgi:hypothetical protein
LLAGLRELSIVIVAGRVFNAVSFSSRVQAGNLRCQPMWNCECYRTDCALQFRILTSLVIWLVLLHTGSEYFLPADHLVLLLWMGAGDWTNKPHCPRGTLAIPILPVRCPDIMVSWKQWMIQDGDHPCCLWVCSYSCHSHRCYLNWSAKNLLRWYVKLCVPLFNVTFVAGYDFSSDCCALCMYVCVEEMSCASKWLKLRIVAQKHRVVILYWLTFSNTISADLIKLLA